MWSSWGQSWPPGQLWPALRPDWAKRRPNWWWQWELKEQKFASYRIQCSDGNWISPIDENRHLKHFRFGQFGIGIHKLRNFTLWSCSQITLFSIFLYPDKPRVPISTFPRIRDLSHRLIAIVRLSYAPLGRAKQNSQTIAPAQTVTVAHEGQRGKLA